MHIKTIIDDCSRILPQIVDMIFPIVADVLIFIWKPDNN